MIKATPADRPAIERFLRAHLTAAMFPLANLARYGMSGGHERAMSFWADNLNTPRAVLGLTDEGMAMPIWDGDHAAAAADILRGRQLKGFTADAAPTRAVMEAVGLQGRPAILDKDEPQYLCKLSELIMPKIDGDLVPIAADPETALEWRVAYDTELGMGTEASARKFAEKSLEGWIAADNHRLLIRDGRPVAMTGFNAALPDIVQVGGVYVPPALRRQGLAGQAVAAHLTEARARGVRQATLFAASPAAGRVYERIGFGHIGSFALVLFDGPQVAQ